MPNWTYDDKPITDISQLPASATGFIYMLVYSTDCAYIGQKSLYSYTTLPALKNGTQRPNSTRVAHNKNGKRVYFDKVQKESNWKSYEGSIKLEEKLKVVKKKILHICYSKRELSYQEVKYQFKYEVLETDRYLNKNILGKFFSGNLQ